MFVTINRKSRVYIVAPANLATGGPELLHQLAHKLKLRNIAVSMYYVPNNAPDPAHNNYKFYDIGYVREIEDTQEHLLIVPETMTEFLSDHQKIRKAVWWLSIDNYFVEQKSLYGKINRFLLRKMGSQRYVGFNRALKAIDYHFFQSEYAKQALAKFGVIDASSLSDYLSQEFLKIETDVKKKENIVAFNPKKGRRFTKKIMKHAPDIKFVPIINMDRAEVVALLQRAKVYIDFGNHPGKDRIPREACMLKCCVITSMKGSAKFYQDVPISGDYKFRDALANIPAITAKIRSCFDNFEENSREFDRYRAIINAQEEIFENEIDEVFRVDRSQ